MPSCGIRHEASPRGEWELLERAGTEVSLTALAASLERSIEKLLPVLFLRLLCAVVAAIPVIAVVRADLGASKVRPQQRPNRCI